MTYFIPSGAPSEREQRARSDYQEAVSAKRGVAFEAHSATSEWTVCRLFVPSDEDEAERLMIPASGIKYSAAQAPLPVILVEPEQWNYLRLRGDSKQPDELFFF